MSAEQHSDAVSEPLNADAKDEGTAPTDHPLKNPAANQQRRKPWFFRYIWEGQSLSQTQQQALSENLADDAPLHQRLLARHRRLLATMIPVVFCQFWWWCLMIRWNLWHLFPEKYYMTITVIFGSLFAGMTSEAAGAVAFPVMTLGFHVAPSVARDFALILQSFGLSAASFVLVVMGVQLEYTVFIFCSLGGVVGIVFGFHVVDPALSPPQKKMIFVSVFFAFASVLFIINCYRKRRTFSSIPNVSLWKVVVLLLAGFCGGVFTSICGNGIDICTFSVVTLLFRLSEKVATPTSILLMAGNSAVGFCWRQFMMAEVSTEAWQYVAVCVQVVVVGAPLGSLIGSHLHRLVLATMVCLLDVAAMVGAWAIIPLTTALIVLSASIVAGGLVIFAGLTVAGQVLLRRYEAGENATEEEAAEATPGGEDGKHSPEALSC